jgi:hypothetical protein
MSEHMSRFDGGKSSGNRTARMVSRVFLGLALLGFVLTLGGCVSCMSSGDSSSKEIYYTGSDGKLASTTQRYGKRPDPRIAVVGAGLCFFSFLGYIVALAVADPNKQP